MLQLVSLLGVGIGVLAILAGLVMIAPQVRVHRIAVWSAGSWVFRAGAILEALGLILLKAGGGPGVLGTVGLMGGIAALLGGLFVLNHERAQALHGGSGRWQWPRSLTAQMMAAGLVLVVLALVV